MNAYGQPRTARHARTDDGLDARLEVRLSSALRSDLRRAADALGMDVATFVRRALLRSVTAADDGDDDERDEEELHAEWEARPATSAAHDGGPVHHAASPNGRGGFTVRLPAGSTEDDARDVLADAHARAVTAPSRVVAMRAGGGWLAWSEVTA